MRRLARDTVSERDRTVTSVYDQWAAIVKPAHHLYIEPTKRHAHLVVPSTRVHADPTHLHHRQSLAVTLMTLNKEPTRAAGEAGTRMRWSGIVGGGGAAG